MRSVRFFLLLLMFLLSQCQWSWNKSSSPVLNPPSSDEKLDSFFCVPDSLIEELPVLPDDYFMTESNIMREEGYELEPQKALAILQQKKGWIIPTSLSSSLLKKSCCTCITSRFPRMAKRSNFWTCTVKSMKRWSRMPAEWRRPGTVSASALSLPSGIPIWRTS